MSPSNEQPVDGLIKRALEDIEAHGLQGLVAYRENHISVLGMYICLGDAVNASRYAKKLRTLAFHDLRIDIMPFLNPLSAAYKSHPLWACHLESDDQRTSRVGALIEYQKLDPGFKRAMCEFESLEDEGKP
ncbi:hypothetical protein C8J57DRAFT_1495587 [Mycena rebaudengoi]|nr:hypothetical protein C8J57DRAFT_1495587 [Mycena rebaudengoi]